MLLPDACTRDSQHRRPSVVKQGTAKAPLEQLAERDPNRANAVMRWAIECQVDIERKLARLSMTGTQQRLAQVLLSLVGQEDMTSEDSRRWIRMTHRDLAYVSVSSLEATRQALEEFTQAGLITQRRGWIRIDHSEYLARVANADRVATTAFTRPLSRTHRN